jgi:large subunit ribosomal protein L11
LILQKLGKEKGSGTPNKEKIGKINMKQVEEIAKQKMPDLNTDKLESAIQMVIGTAKNMGVTVE